MADPTDIADDFEQLLSRRQVCAIAGLSYPTIWQLMRDGQFPLARRISLNRVAWLKSEVIAWLRSRPVQVYKPNSGGVS